MKESNRLRKVRRKNDKKIMQNVHQAFKETISEGPECVCAVCHARLFRKQVIQCKRETYRAKGHIASSIADKCITETYLHTCDKKCNENCLFSETAASKLWVCHTCNRKMLAGKLPHEATANNLHLDPIPNELNCLNELEQHLISLHIPFMKVLPLPKGGQNGVHGPVVCVPSSIQKVATLLPRCSDENKMLKVKLKRKLTYKGKYQYNFVNTERIRNAIHYLKTNNKLYEDVEFDKKWENPLSVIVEEPTSTNTDAKRRQKDN